ncbi:uncharacterized protein [Centroberyx affinis]|uniref:uncharacterized protein n=1 Tax=Centroberyx affinis TaxID=166261 RepID=UPI003A5BFB28
MPMPHASETDAHPAAVFSLDAQKAFDRDGLRGRSQRLRGRSQQRVELSRSSEESRVRTAAAMLVLSALLVLLMKTHAASEEPTRIFVRSGESVQLTFDLGEKAAVEYDFRWKLGDKALTVHNGVTEDFRSRCRLQPNGFLLLSSAQSSDTGNYSLEVFDESTGKLQLHKHFLLTVLDPSSRLVLSASCSLDGRVFLNCSVEGERDRIWPDQGSVIVVWLPVCSFLLLFSFLIFVFVLRKRRSQRSRPGGTLEDNIYVSMRGNHGDKKEEEKKTTDGGEEETECPYVICAPGVSTATPITRQTSVDTDGIYM